MGHERVDRKRRLETLGKGAGEVVVLAFISLLAGGGTCLVRKNLQLIEQNDDPIRYLLEEGVAGVEKKEELRLP